MMDLPPEFAPSIPGDGSLVEGEGDVAAAASLSLPPEFAPSISGGEGLVEGERDVAAAASLCRPPEFAPSIFGREGLVEGEEDGTTQSWWESSESSSEDSNITTVYVGNRL